jgi:glycosyltransferase involved in cell wall biosynthesis
MKVLVCHNRYRSIAPSGENRYVEDEIALLRDAGIDVVTMLEESDSINGRLGMANAALGLAYSPTGVRRFQRMLQAERPDIVHIHNVYPLISPQVIRIAKAAGVPVVHRVHNHAHTCVAGAHFRDGRQCDDCFGRRIAYPAIEHGCYRESRPLSVAKVLTETAHRGTWRMVDKYLVHTPFMASRLLSIGLDSSQITVFPPYAPDPGEPTTSPGEDFLFLGRLDEGKGIVLLIDAWRSRRNRGSSRLHIVGTGPLESQVLSMAQDEDDIDFIGYLEHDQALSEVQRCGVVLVPSLFYEAGLPLVAIEALASGRPIIVNSSTSFASVVSDEFGWRADPTVDSWREVIDGITQEDIAARGLAGRKHYVGNCSSSAAITSLIKIYEDLLTRPE